MRRPLVPRDVQESKVVGCIKRSGDVVLRVWKAIQHALEQENRDALEAQKSRQGSRFLTEATTGRGQQVELGGQKLPQQKVLLPGMS